MKLPVVLVAQPDHIEWPAVVRVVGLYFQVPAAVARVLANPAVAQRIANNDVR